MIPVVEPRWLNACVDAGKWLPTHSFSPDPRLIFKLVFACISDTISISDREIIYGAIKAFGGQYNDVLTRSTTHLITTDTTNEKYLLATSTREQDGIVIATVLPYWVNRCVTNQCLVDDSPYIVLEHRPITDIPISAVQDSVPGNSVAGTTKVSELMGKRVYISGDYQLGIREQASIHLLINLQGAIVELRFDAHATDFYLGKFREGNEYELAMKLDAIVGNLDWFYHLVFLGEFTLPQNGNMLYFPYPQVRPLEGLSISITNYTGDTRQYLIKLIELLGGMFTKTLTRSNQYLLSRSGEGKKYDTARFKWLDGSGNPVISLVNHLWLEECYRNVSHEDVDIKHTEFEDLPPVGLVRLPPSLWSLGVDSVPLSPVKKLEPEPSQTQYPESQNDEKSQYLQKSQTPTQVESGVVLVDFLSQPSKASQASQSTQASTQASPSQSSRPLPLQPSRSSHPSSSSHPSPPSLTPSTLPSQPSLMPPPRGRSAARKAAEKLHNNMSDLNQFEAAKSSKRKMKDYLVNVGMADESQMGPDSQSSAKRTKKTNSQKLIAKCIVTGYRDLTRLQLADLSAEGIKMADEKLMNGDTLVAPKVMRTEKFLRGIARVSRVIHPDFFQAVLSGTSANMDDFLLDKKVSTSELNQELGWDTNQDSPLETLILKRPLDGLFHGLKVNLSPNLNGGVDLIGRVLDDHGMSGHLVLKSNAKDWIKCDDNQAIFICHSSKDLKLIKAITREVKKTGEPFHIIEWDWCVQSIFHMELLPFENHSLI